MPKEKTDKLLRLNQIVPEILPISKTTWWNGVRSGLYPQPIKLGPRTTVWRESDVMEIVKHGTQYNDSRFNIKDLNQLTPKKEK